MVRDGEVVWARGYGWADIEHGRRATADSVFMLASISKTVMATAAMQAVEDGLLTLDGDVNESSIRDNWDIIVPTYVKGDSKVPLGGYLHRYLHAPSDIYRPHKNYNWWAPGTHYQYCNIAASLAGFLVEAASGTPFDVWCDRRIFRPLGMTNTGWHLADVERDTVAMPYRIHGGRFHPYGQYGYPDYPDGELRTSARHLAHHLSSFVRWPLQRIVARLFHGYPGGP